MDSVHAARRRYGSGIEKVTGQIGADLSIDLSQAQASLLSSREFSGDWSLWEPNGRGRYQKDGRNGHARFDGGQPDLIYKGGDALTCRPSVVVGVTELKVV